MERAAHYAPSAYPGRTLLAKPTPGFCALQINPLNRAQSGRGDFQIGSSRFCVLRESLVNAKTARPLPLGGDEEAERESLQPFGYALGLRK